MRVVTLSVKVRRGGLELYIPIAIHKNELVVIDNMDTFSRYFCLAKKQKMTPLASDDKVLATPEELEEERGIFEDDEHSASSSDAGAATDLDDDDI
jgi:hypothetical protein